jgi:nucleoid associated protein NdpA
MPVPQLANLQIKKIIAHQIFKRNEERAVVSPQYSSDFTELNPAGITTLQERVTEALGNDSYCIEMTIARDGAGSTYDLCNQMIDADDDETFKKASKELATNLANAQSTRRIPGGILVIFSGTVGPDDFEYIGIIKAELHEGFGLHEVEQKLSIEFIAKLLLTPQQKLYKIAMLVLKGTRLSAQTRTPADYDVFVYDHNMTRSETRQAALYFYDHFLGCAFSPSAKKLTSDFYTYTKEFINSLNYNNEDKVDLNTSLYTYLKVAQSNVVDASEYANEYFPVDIRDNYLSHLKSNNFPLNAVTKDITYLKYKLQRRNLKFSSDVKINAPAEGFSDLVKIQSTDDNRTNVLIKGTLERED